MPRSSYSIEKPLKHVIYLLQVPMETGSKKHIIAERYLETGVAESLSNLFVSNYPAFKVLSLYADLSKRLIAYKILNQSEGIIDPWFDAGFKDIITVDFNLEYSLVPIQFSDNSSSFSNSTGFQIQGNKLISSNHFVYGIAEYNALILESSKVYLFKLDNILTVMIFKDKSCIFSNYFVCQNETEILYFVLSALESSDCAQDEANVFLDYHLASNGSAKQFLSPYFKSISNLRMENDLLDEEILDLPELLFINHAMSLCV